MKPVSEGRDGNVSRRTYKLLKMRKKTGSVYMEVVA